MDRKDKKNTDKMIFSLNDRIWTSKNIHLCMDFLLQKKTQSEKR